MTDIVALGELLIDFTPDRVDGVPCFQQNAGGAPANVAVAAAAMGKQTAFIGKVGNDAFGLFLHQTLANKGVDVRGLRRSDKYPTTLAFVHLDDAGERSFSFYRNQTADVMLQTADVDLTQFTGCRVFHFGSVSLTTDPSRTTTLDTARSAKHQGSLVSFDPNIRLSLWDSEEEARTQILNAMALADILKISDEELTFLTGESDIQAGAAALRKLYDFNIILVTRGALGCEYFTACGQGSVPSFQVKAVDTTGAGDGFTGAFLSGILEADKPLQSLNTDEIDRCIRVANAYGALTTTKPGGIPALPTRAEVLSFIQAQGV